MAECGITYCDRPAVKPVQTSAGERVLVCDDHGDVYEPLTPAKCEGTDGVNATLDRRRRS